MNDLADKADKSEPFGLERFRQIIARKIEEAGFFDPSGRIVITRAPGRLDLMGGIADYSGSLVLQYPIKEATFAAAQLSCDRRIKIDSVKNHRTLKGFLFETDLEQILTGGRLGDPTRMRRHFANDPQHRWAAYAAGVFPILADALNTDFARGIRILIWSAIPLGKGVSSSAALEVAVMKAVYELFRPAGFELTCREFALLCQRVENEVVGAPCGVMDQMASACGPENGLIELVCQPAELHGTIDLSDEIELWGIDSGIRHSVAGADYGTVRTAAFMGYRMIAGIAGLKVEDLTPGRVTVEDPQWKGYLANIDPAEFEARFSAHLPSSITGREFLELFSGISDPHSVVDPARKYPVHAATAHPVYENARVHRFAELLRSRSIETDLIELGDLMYASHESYSKCGLGSDGTDLLVDLVRRDEPGKGLYGAKITGGGSGGTVAVLARKESQTAIETVAREYQRLSGRNPRIFRGSSPGAFQFGVMEFGQSPN